MEEILFSGTRDMRGCLSNEGELFELCPDEFRSEDNEWSLHAFWLSFAGGAIDHWQWKSNDEAVCDRQFYCFIAMIQSCGLGYLDRYAVAGWMLSEMLIEIPEAIRAEPPRFH